MNTNLKAWFVLCCRNDRTKAKNMRFLPNRNISAIVYICSDHAFFSKDYVRKFWQCRWFLQFLTDRFVYSICRFIIITETEISIGGVLSRGHCLVMNTLIPFIWSSDAFVLDEDRSQVPNRHGWHESSARSTTSYYQEAVMDYYLGFYGLCVPNMCLYLSTQWHRGLLHIFW